MIDQNKFQRLNIYMLKKRGSHKSSRQKTWVIVSITLVARKVFLSTTLVRNKKKVDRFYVKFLKVKNDHEQKRRDRAKAFET